MADAILAMEKLDFIRVLAAESTRMSCQLLADSLARDKRFRVCEVEPTATAILAAVASERPQVVVLSAALEKVNTRGFGLARQVRAAHPDVRIVMLLDASERFAVVEAFRSGARGVFCRTESLTSLAKCIQSVHMGQVWANSGELRYVLDALSEAAPLNLMISGRSAILSKREQDVVRCVAQGLSNREVAQHLNLTEHTVKNYLFRIFDKLGVSSRVEMVLYALSLSRELVTPGARITPESVVATLPNGTATSDSSLSAHFHTTTDSASDLLRRARALQD